MRQRNVTEHFETFLDFLEKEKVCSRLKPLDCKDLTCFLFHSTIGSFLCRRKKEKNVLDKSVPPMSHPLRYPHRSLWFSRTTKAADFNEIPPEIRTTDLYIRRERHQLWSLWPLLPSSVKSRKWEILFIDTKRWWKCKNGPLHPTSSHFFFRWRRRRRRWRRRRQQSSPREAKKSYNAKKTTTDICRVPYLPVKKANKTFCHF